MKNGTVKISHESPLDIMHSHSRLYNDFCYGLVHLFDHPQFGEEYFNFFKESLDQGREVLLDNSIFELKTAFDSDKFAAAVQKLKPTYYIVPDALDDAKKTMEQYEDWLVKYADDCPGTPIGVVQGKTLEEIIRCYEYLVSRGCKYIAMSFDMEIFQTIGYGPTKLERCTTGRQQLISMLNKCNVWDVNIAHHLLGCSLAEEFEEYDYERINIVSVDTSNPVIAGIKGYTYNGYDESSIAKSGLSFKDTILLADLIGDPTSDDQKKEIVTNCVKFRSIVYNETYKPSSFEEHMRRMEVAAKNVQEKYDDEVSKISEGIFNEGKKIGLSDAYCSLAGDYESSDEYKLYGRI